MFTVMPNTGGEIFSPLSCHTGEGEQERRAMKGKKG